MRKIIAILLAFLLTGALLLFCMSFLGRQALMPAMNEQGTPASDELIREEQQLIRERVTSLAELHGFQAEPVIALINEDTLRDLNAQASKWWSSILTTGKPTEGISWNTDKLEELLSYEIFEEIKINGQKTDQEYGTLWTGWTKLAHYDVHGVEASWAEDFNINASVDHINAVKARLGL